MVDKPLANVLIVEDDPGVVRLQQLRLQRCGYNVEIATTAAEALALIEKVDIDLLLLDQALPDGPSGLELYQHIKQSGLEVPAILVTGFPSESIVLESFRAGVFDFVPKTTDYLDYLLPTVERVLKKRRTECQLIESEASLSSMFRTALDAVLTVEEGKTICLFNPAAEQLFGMSGKEVQGQPLQRFLPDLPHRLSHRAEHWQTEGVRVDGSRFPVEVSVSWVELPRRQFWTCFVRDITERQRGQQEQEQRIREQTARQEAEAGKERMESIAVENDRLYQELRQVDRLKDEFLAMLAHELRNPLAPISNALNLIQLESPAQTSPAEENWGIIERQVGHLVRLVDDLLDVSRISKGKIQLQLERLDLAGVVARSVESSQPLISARRHTLRVHLPQGQVPVEGDPVRLIQVLTNLLNNAAKYTPEGGHIDLILERDKGQATVRVRDTGVGIPPEILPRLFDLFTQSQRTLDRAEGGLGIGLTLVRRLTEMHGGKVEVRSEGSGKGSEFIVYLPTIEGQVPLPVPETPALTPVTTADRRRILVVDDNPDSTKTLTRLLQKLGHEVTNAHSGTEALKAAEGFHPEIILLDIGLPGMDGYEVCSRLRLRGDFARTVIVAVTGYGSPEDRQRSQRAGFNAHLVKPVDLETLKQLVAQPVSIV